MSARARDFVRDLTAIVLSLPLILVVKMKPRTSGSGRGRNVTPITVWHTTDEPSRAPMHSNVVERKMPLVGLLAVGY